ncbi:DYH17 protein, partial [Pardalotus punctatus]|nr:DYH17 protein [Pardalotus punctatus]
WGQEWDPGIGPALPPCHPEATQTPGGVGRAASSCSAMPQHGVYSCSRPYRSDPRFNPEFIKTKSTAAAGLCSWCLNMVRFYEVYCIVKPKRQAVAD